MENLLKLVEKNQFEVSHKGKELTKEEIISLIEVIKVCSNMLSDEIRKIEELKCYIVYIEEIDINTMDMIEIIDPVYFKENYI